MRFVDQCRMRAIAGDGGNGVVAFRRERFRPFGGPSGGDGGRGGDVVLVAAGGLSSLQDVAYQHTVRGERGGHGQGSDCYGRAGEDATVRVPLGTQVLDEDTGELIGDLTEDGQRIVIVKGGRGGRGNIHFATPFDRAPRRAEKGEPGEQKNIRLELKVMADVGLLGFPNVGKSTMVASLSAARPKIADYPFTTLVPSLGVVAVGGGPRLGGTSFVIADIPGLIPGASEGVGLGIEFLKHVERTRALLHLVTFDPAEGREPLADYRSLRAELAKFSPELCDRPEVVALSKADLPEVREAYPALAARFAKNGVRLHLVSAATRDGLDDLVRSLVARLRGEQDGSVMTPSKSKPASPQEKAAGAPAKKKAAPPAPKKKTPAKKTAAPPAPKKKTPAKKTAAPPAPKKKTPAKKKAAPPAPKKKTPAKKTAAPPAPKKKTPAKKKAAPPAPKKKTPAKKKAAPRR